MAETMIYYAEAGERRGPFTLHDITPYLRPDTPVWYQGLTDWMPAAQAPLTSHLFAHTPPPPREHGYRDTYSYRHSDSMPPRPATYLVWAILVTIFCCLPLGVVSIVYAARVDSLYNQGLYDEALDASKKAKMWVIWSVVATFVSSLIYIIFNIGLFAAMFANV